MSIFYTEGNNEGAKRLFQKRSYYSDWLTQYQRDYTNLVDFNFAEKQFYGRVDRRFVPRVVRNSGSIQLKTFNQSNLGGPPMFALNFVVDAFNDLAQQFQKCAMLGKIDTQDTYLTNLKVYNAFQQPQGLYSEQLLLYGTDISNFFARNNVTYKNFDEFMVQLNGLFEGLSFAQPYTYPAFVKSRFCPILVSGLAIEIADLGTANDQQKIDQFVQSPNWSFYVNACRSFGFMVDKNVPWRLVADIGSSEMMKYAARYGMNTTNQILSTGYSYAHNRYFKQFKLNLLRLYKAFKLPTYTEKTICNDGSINTIIITPKDYNIKTYLEEYDDLYFLREYFKIRFKEEESKFTDSDIHLLVDDVEELYNVFGLDRALTLLETILNKPFDYRGSWTYIKAQRKATNDLSDTG